MKKILPILVLTSLVLPVMTLAAEEYQELPELEVIATITRIGDLIFTILLALAVIFIVVGGVMFVTAAGSVEKTTQARTMIMYALIGIVIAFLARGIVLFITNYLMP